MFLLPFKFENPVKTPNASGGMDESYQEFYTSRGHFEMSDGQRGLETGYDQVIEVFKMYCFWRSALEELITKDTRVIYDNKVFRIDKKERYKQNHQYYEMTISTFY